MSQEENPQQNMAQVNEPTIKFKAISDRSIYKVISSNNPDITLIEITGYDLQINFNMEYLKTLEDINAACDAIGTLFRDIILEKHLESKQKPE